MPGTQQLRCFVGIRGGGCLFYMPAVYMLEILACKFASLPYILA